MRLPLQPITRNSLAAASIAALGLCTGFGAEAADTFDPASHVLLVPSISVAGSPYVDVAAKITSYTLLGIDGGTPVADVFDSASNLLTLGTVMFQGSTYNNVRATVNAYTLIRASSSPSTSQRMAAATATAQSSSNHCAEIAPYYWETGDKNGALVSGSVASASTPGTYTASSQMNIASASKWLYGAYVTQRRAGALNESDIKFLSFRSGYTNFTTCLPGQTVGSCAGYLTNGLHSNFSDGKFLYDGGHMQNHADLLGLGALDNAGLAAEVRSQIGTDIGLSYSQPQPAGGGISTANDYARFLRKLLNRQLAMASLLGTSVACTNPTTCPSGQALGTPVPTNESWHYSIGHWVEDDPAIGDGAYSSPGAFGFYPWIDASRNFYGIVARKVDGGWYGSAQCGRQIRKAWITGVVQ